MRLPDAVAVRPLGEAVLRGTIAVPGDKSISHRALLLGALCDGPVRVAGAAPSQDVQSTVAALRSMGTRIVEDRGTVQVMGRPTEPDQVLDCGNSGTSLRLLMGVCAGVHGVSVLTGDASLRRRPMGRVAEPLRLMGATVDGRDGGRLAPLVVRGGALRAIDYRLPIPSAQVKSAVLLAGLHADGATTVTEPAPLRDHTERMLAWLGASVRRDGASVRVEPGRLCARDLQVPGDPSSAAFWAVAAAIAPDAQVHLTDVCLNPTRTGALDVLRAMRAAVVTEATAAACGEPVGSVTVANPRAGGLHGPVRVGGDLVVRAIDELPVLAVAGAAGGGLVVGDAAELRVKESDRIAGIVGMLTALGAAAEATADGFEVAGGARLRGGTVDSGGDHRIAMAAAVAALVASQPVTITGFACVATSYPSFLADLAALGGHWEQIA